MNENAIKEKWCYGCKAIRPNVVFTKNSASKDGLSSECRPCKKIRAKNYYTKNIEKIKDKAKTAAARLRARAYTRTPKARRTIFNGHLKRKFGITADQYEGMFRRQNGACAICRGINLNGKRLCVDHDHRTGIVRALLCDVCNTTLGKVGESIEILTALSEYIERWKRICGSVNV